MKLHRVLAPVTLAATALSSAATVSAAEVLTQFGTAASIASFSCATQACDPRDDPFLFAGSLSLAALAGGVGQGSASVATGTWPDPGSASGSVTVASALAVPLLKAGAAAPRSATGSWLAGQPLPIQGYTYTGLGETLSLNWDLTGSVANPDDVSATGLVMFAGFLSASELSVFPDLSNPPTAISLLVSLSADPGVSFASSGATAPSSRPIPSAST